MSEVINILERLGQDAGLRPVATDTDYSALATLEIRPELRGALTSMDSAALGVLLGAKTHLVCGLFPGKEEEESPDEDSPDKDDAPPADDAEKMGQSNRRWAVASVR